MEGKDISVLFFAYISSSQTIIDGTSGQEDRAEPMGKWCLLA